jgi:LmbE family N-acetylglucosaminyl deacetylase
VVRLIREIRPQIIITHDETGGYFHPDHIQCWKITVPAFHAAGDPEQFPEIGPAPYEPERLYFSAFPNSWVKFFIFLFRLRGQDPTKFGRNQDIDMTKVGVDRSQLHAFVNYRNYWEVKQAASAAHASQGGGSAFGWLPQSIQKLLLARDTFMRAYPPVPRGYREKDLFTGIGE